MALETIPAQLRTIFEQAAQFYIASDKTLHEKIAKLEDERKVFLGLLEDQKSIEKENVELKFENKFLKDQIDKNKILGSDDHKKLDDLEKKNKALKKKLHRFLHTVQKKCTCSFRDTVTKNMTPLHNSSSCKTTNVSNVFFKSPVKLKNNQIVNVLLAPMTEDFSVETPKGALQASTPVIVGETERNPFEHFEIDSDDTASDCDWPNSPSLFTSHNNDESKSTPFDVQKMMKCDGVRNVVNDDTSFENPKTKYNEISAELFSDESPRGALKSIVIKNNLESISTSANAAIQKKNCTNPQIMSSVSDSKSIKENIPILPHGFKPTVSNQVETLEEKEKKEISLYVSNDSGITTNKSEINRSQKMSSKDSIPVKASNGFISAVAEKKVINEEKPISKKKKSKGKTEANYFDDDSFFEISQCIEQKHKIPKIMPETKLATDQSSSSTSVTSDVKDSLHREEKDQNLTDKKGSKKKSEVKYKYSTVVRKKDEREKLNGYACEECRRYYQSDNLTEERLQEILKQCSRHRHESSPPPSTPEGFWNLDFPPTQDCIDKGYMLDADQTLPDYAKPKLRKQKQRKDVKFE